MSAGYRSWDAVSVKIAVEQERAMIRSRALDKATGLTYSVITVLLFLAGGTAATFTFSGLHPVVIFWAFGGFIVVVQTVRLLHVRQTYLREVRSLTSPRRGNRNG